MKTVFFFLFLSLFLTGCGLQGSPGDIAAENGFNAYNNGNYEESVDFLRQARELGTRRHEDSLILTGIGKALSELNQLDEAVEAHQQALELSPNAHNIWVNLGVVYRLQNEYGEAEKCYLKALSIEPDYPELHASLGALFLFQEKMDKAIEHLEKATVLEPTLAVGWSNLSVCYAVVGRHDEADQALETALKNGYPNGDVVKQMLADYRAAESQE